MVSGLGWLKLLLRTVVSTTTGISIRVRLTYLNLLVGKGDSRIHDE